MKELGSTQKSSTHKTLTPLGYDFVSTADATIARGAKSATTIATILQVFRQILVNLRMYKYVHINYVITSYNAKVKLLQNIIAWKGCLAPISDR